MKINKNKGWQSTTQQGTMNTNRIHCILIQLSQLGHWLPQKKHAAHSATKIYNNPKGNQQTKHGNSSQVNMQRQ